jgi:prepilin-type N-terminal cleavage/methylation domain-containing protein
VKIKKSQNNSKIIKKGFTLIELMTVVSIISLLSSVVLTAVQDNRNRAKDRALVESAIQLRNALELYRTDYGQYPDDVNSGEVSYFCSLTSCGTSVTSGPSVVNFKQLLKPYIQTILVPQYSQTLYYFYYNPTGKCEGQNSSSKYLILIDTRSGDKTFPRYLMNSGGGNYTAHATLRCLSSP